MQNKEHLQLSLSGMGWFDMIINRRADFITPHSKEVEGHIHPYYELYIHLDGDISFVVHDSIHRMTHGDMILTPPHTLHHCVCHTACQLDHYCIFIRTTDSTILSTLSRLAGQCLLRYEHQTAKELLSLLEEMTGLLEQSHPSTITGYSLLFRFLDLLSTTLRQDANAHTYYPDNFQSILNHIGKHYADIQSIRELCDAFYISQASLERLFRQYMQIKPYQYILQTRLAHACRLLSGGESVSVVAAKCGFSDCSHFIAVFKKKFGVTPGSYRVQWQSKRS